jgi:hypothetical protein
MSQPYRPPWPVTWIALLFFLHQLVPMLDLIYKCEQGFSPAYRAFMNSQQLIITSSIEEMQCVKSDSFSYQHNS